MIDGRRKFDGGVADPLPVRKAYELGAKRIIVIRTYEEKFKRKLIISIIWNMPKAIFIKYAIKSFTASKI